MAFFAVFSPHWENNMMRKMEKHSKGFTFIEILVVLIILGLVTSLIGPRLFHAYEGIQVSAEEKKMEEIIEKIKIISFLRQVPHTVRLEGRTISVMNNDIRVEFRYLYFPVEVLKFNKNGFADISKIRYLVEGKERVIHVSLQ
jgi:prepilin-type N-terminal cleavage/methylation domain-containing protein